MRPLVVIIAMIFITHNAPGQTWLGPGGGAGSGISTPTELAVYQGKLFVAGIYSTIPDIGTVQGVATWDGSSWDTIPSKSGL